LCCFKEFVDHGGFQGNTTQALTKWHHPGTSSKALDVLHRVMRPAWYCRIRMAIEIASNSPAFFFIIYFVFANNLR